MIKIKILRKLRIRYRMKQLKKNNKKIENKKAK